MIPIYCLIFIAAGLLPRSQSLQSGYTCGTTVTLTCPDLTKLVIIEVTYSSECPSATDEDDGGAVYAPARCIGYYGERASALCNGKQTCTIDNSIEQRPSFLTGKQANCAFKGQSINVDYSCIPDFYSSQLPRIDICSLQSLQGLKEGFIHTPNYPGGYPNSKACSKTVPSPGADHRLKIYALDFDIEGLSALRLLGITRINDWLQINNSGEKMYGTRGSFHLLFDDVIEASLMFKSDFANTKRSYKGFLLYFIVTPIRGSRPSTISTMSTTEKSTLPMLLNDNDASTISAQSKSAALLSSDRQPNNVGLTVMVVLLSGTLFVIICAFLLYKRRNDRRVRYLADMFQSFFPGRPKNVTLNTTDMSDETTLNNTIQSKLDVSSLNNAEKCKAMNDYDEKYLQTPTMKHVNINEKHQSQEKQIFIENLKTCPSPYSSYRRSDQQVHARATTGNEAKVNSNIYSQDPLAQRNALLTMDTNSSLYEYVDLSKKQEPAQDSKQGQEEVIYDVINTNNERSNEEETDYDSVVYATPKVENPKKNENV